MLMMCVAGLLLGDHGIVIVSSKARDRCYAPKMSEAPDVLERSVGWPRESKRGFRGPSETFWLTTFTALFLALNRVQQIVCRIGNAD